MYVVSGTYLTSTLGWIRDKDGSIKRDEKGNIISQKIPDAGGDTPFIEIGKCSQI
jgi:hypothetical protein